MTRHEADYRSVGKTTNQNTERFENSSAYAKPAAQLVVRALEKYGVKDVVLSPGTRNAPLLLACSANGSLQCHTIIDERSAAFYALGMSSCSQRPVALACTSGSALLNYAPALAEAYYRQIPLIVLSADRPKEWIDQSDSQTIRQTKALSAVVKKNFDVPDFKIDDINLRDYAARLVSDALSTAIKKPCGPVHINLPFDLPLGLDYQKLEEYRLPTVISQPPHLSNMQLKELANRCVGRKLLFVCGSLPANHRLNKAFNRLALIPGSIVLAEPTANLHGENIISNIEGALGFLDSRQSPDVTVVCGGALIGDRLKKYLRSLKDCEQWYVAPYSDTIQDTFRTLSISIESDPDKFFPTFASLVLRNRDMNDSGFSKLWKEASIKAGKYYSDLSSSAPWSELKALSKIFPQIPESFNLHLSNGTAIRYALLHGRQMAHTFSCNRGVSGIEGSTSTAIGASFAYRNPTLLISGDMSFSYDMGALAIKEIPNNFKAIVLSNDGGGIFRVINKTVFLPKRERLFCQPPRLPLKQLADAYNFRYLYSDSEERLDSSLPDFLNNNSQPAILELKFDPEISADVFRSFCKFNNPL